jgi:hypothetical protein
VTLHTPTQALLHAATVLLADHAALLQHTQRMEVLAPTQPFHLLVRKYGWCERGVGTWQVMALRKAAAAVQTTQRELLEVRFAPHARAPLPSPQP